MKKPTTSLIAIVMLLAMTMSSLASESTPPAASLSFSPVPSTLTAPTMLTRKVALDAAELAKYRQLSAHAHGLAMGEAAGASDTTKTVLIVVGVVVVVVGVLALVATHGGKGFPVGNSFAN
jgi:hypothetical protein